MCARDELQHIIWRHDVWRNIYQHELWHNIHHDDVYVHDYDVNVDGHPDGCSGTCANNDIYVHGFGDIDLHDAYDDIDVHDDRLNNDYKLNDDGVFINLCGQHADFESKYWLDPDAAAAWGVSMGTPYGAIER